VENASKSISIIEICFQQEGTFSTDRERQFENIPSIRIEIFLFLFSHPSSLQRHYRQCKRQSAFRQLNPSNSKLLDETTLKPVTNMINQQQNLVDS